MRVLEPGRKQQGWAGEFTCTGAGNSDGGCGAKLLVEQRDLFSTIRSSMGESDLCTTFKCCACGVLTDIPPSKAPSARLPTRSEWESSR